MTARRRGAAKVASLARSLLRQLLVTGPDLGARWISSNQRPATLDLTADEALEAIHLDGIARKLFCQITRHDDNAIGIAHDDFSRINGDTATADRHVVFDG